MAMNLLNDTLAALADEQLGDFAGLVNFDF